MTNKSCNECKYWEQGELVDSGITAADGNGNWHYYVGKCEYPEALHSNPPAWNKCHFLKRKKKGAKS